MSIGVRPENTRIDSADGGELAFPGAVDLIEHLGEVQILYLDVPGHTEKFLLKAVPSRCEEGSVNCGLRP